jgi:hypothetical protein
VNERAPKVGQVWRRDGKRSPLRREIVAVNLADPQIVYAVPGSMTIHLGVSLRAWERWARDAVLERDA